MQPENAYMFPTSVKEVQALGWDYIDVIMVTGDAFVDHPSFGTEMGLPGCRCTAAQLAG